MNGDDEEPLEKRDWPPLKKPPPPPPPPPRQLTEGDPLRLEKFSRLPNSDFLFLK